MSRKTNLTGLIFMIVVFLMGAVALAAQVDGIGKNPGNVGGQGQGGGERHEKKISVHGPTNPKDPRAIEMIMDESDDDVEVKMNIDGKCVREIKGKFKIDKNRPEEDEALDFIDRHRNAFKLKNPKAEMLFDKKDMDSDETYIHFLQTVNGVKVSGSGMGIHIDKNGNIYRISSSNIPTPDIDTVPSITPEQAIEIARRDVTKSDDGKIGFSKTHLFIDNNKLVYYVFFLHRYPWMYIINAKTGEVIGREDRTSP